MARQTVGGDIIYSDDIIKKVSEKMGIDEKKVRIIFNFIFSHIKQLARKPDVFSMPLKGIGRLYMCTERSKKVLLNREKYHQVSSRQRERHRELKAKINRMDEIYKEESKGEFLYSVHKKRSSLANYFYNGKKTLKELEEEQNEESRKFDQKEQNYR
jgi:hypothetical protein